MSSYALRRASRRSNAGAGGGEGRDPPDSPSFAGGPPPGQPAPAAAAAAATGERIPYAVRRASAKAKAGAGGPFGGRDPADSPKFAGGRDLGDSLRFGGGGDEDDDPEPAPRPSRASARPSTAGGGGGRESAFDQRVRTVRDRIREMMVAAGDESSGSEAFDIHAGSPPAAAPSPVSRQRVSTAPAASGLGVDRDRDTAGATRRSAAAHGAAADADAPPPRRSAAPKGLGEAADWERDSIGSAPAAASRRSAAADAGAAAAAEPAAAPAPPRRSAAPEGLGGRAALDRDGAGGAASAAASRRSAAATAAAQAADADTPPAAPARRAAEGLGRAAPAAVPSFGGAPAQQQRPGRADDGDDQGALEARLAELEREREALAKRIEAVERLVKSSVGDVRDEVRSQADALRGDARGQVDALRGDVQAHLKSAERRIAADVLEEMDRRVKAEVASAVAKLLETAAATATGARGGGLGALGGLAPKKVADPAPAAPLSSPFPVTDEPEQEYETSAESASCGSLASAPMSAPEKSFPVPEKPAAPLKGQHSKPASLPAAHAEPPPDGCAEPAAHNLEAIGKIARRVSQSLGGKDAEPLPADSLDSVDRTGQNSRSAAKDYDSDGLEAEMERLADLRRFASSVLNAAGGGPPAQFGTPAPAGAAGGWRAPQPAAPQQGWPSEGPTFGRPQEQPQPQPQQRAAAGRAPAGARGSVQADPLPHGSAAALPRFGGDDPSPHFGYDEDSPSPVASESRWAARQQQRDSYAPGPGAGPPQAWGQYPAHGGASAQALGKAREGAGVLPPAPAPQLLVAPQAQTQPAPQPRGSALGSFARGGGAGAASGAASAGLPASTSPPASRGSVAPRRSNAALAPPPRGGPGMPTWPAAQPEEWDDDVVTHSNNVGRLVF